MKVYLKHTATCTPETVLISGHIHVLINMAICSYMRKKPCNFVDPLALPPTVIKAPFEDLKMCSFITYHSTTDAVAITPAVDLCNHPLQRSPDCFRLASWSND